MSDDNPAVDPAPADPDASTPPETVETPVKSTDEIDNPTPSVTPSAAKPDAVIRPEEDTENEYVGPSDDEKEAARAAAEDAITATSEDPTFTADEATTLGHIAELTGLGQAGITQLAALNDLQPYGNAYIPEGKVIRLPSQYTYVDIDGVTTK